VLAWTSQETVPEATPNKPFHLTPALGRPVRVDHDHDDQRRHVVVSRRQVATPEDLREGEIVYRHVNVAVDPRTPSQG